MKGYYVKKALSAIIVLLVIVSLNFFLPRLQFADPATPYYVGIPEDRLDLREAVREEYGFNDPLIVQYLKYMGRIFTLNFGQSYIYKESVWKVMFTRIPWTLVLTLTSMVCSVIIGIIFGAQAGQNRGKKMDKTLMGLSTVTTALPGFWLALVFIILFAFMIPLFPYRGAMTAGYALHFNVLPFWIILGSIICVAFVLERIFKKQLFLIIGIPVALIVAIFVAVPADDIMDVLYHAALPLIVNIITGSISYAMLVRNSMIAVTNEDYILTARAKGLPASTVLYKHTFKNALLPLITNIGLSMSGLFGGSVLIEKIFSWPGMGQLLLDATNKGDYLLSQAILLLFATITIVCNFITDLVYHKFDPRVTEA